MNTAKLSTNQRIGLWNAKKQQEKEDALKALELAKSQNKPIKYDLKR